MSTSSEHRPTVSIVIPTCNNILLLSKCLSSVRALSYPRDKVEVVVVDNASSDGTMQALETVYSSVIRLGMETNTGFAAACNTGAATASGDYVAFLNDDAVPEPGWLEALFQGLQAGGDGTVCVASRILSADGTSTEYSGGSANLFGVGRPRPIWGWPGALEKPEEGGDVLFASGGAMLIHRRTFLDVGGFDPQYFAYFEDVDLGWRLWLLGHRVVYAPEAVVRHIGGATGSRAGAHRRQTLWECNSLATVLKNYEAGNMERLLTAALLLLYKRALLASSGSINPTDYLLTGPKDTNTANVESVPKVSVAHLAAIDRFNSLLPHFMEGRSKIQARRVRTDAEILPLLGRFWEPQFAGEEYAQASREIANWIGVIEPSNGRLRKVLIVAPEKDEESTIKVATLLTEQAIIAIVLLEAGGHQQSANIQRGFARYSINADHPDLRDLVRMAEALLVFEGAERIDAIREAGCPTAILGEPGRRVIHDIRIAPDDTERLIAFSLGNPSPDSS